MGLFNSLILQNRHGKTDPFIGSALIIFDISTEIPDGPQAALPAFRAGNYRASPHWEEGQELMTSCNLAGRRFAPSVEAVLLFDRIVYGCEIRSFTLYRLCGAKKGAYPCSLLSPLAPQDTFVCQFLFCLPSNYPSPTTPRIWPRPDGHATPNSRRRILREPFAITCHTYRRWNRQIRNDTMVGEDLIGWQHGGVRQDRIRPVPGIIAMIRQETSIEDLVPMFECTRPRHLMIRKPVCRREGIIP